MSSYPNVPPGQTDWERRIAQAVNFLLNQVQRNTLIFDGLPDDGESLVLMQFDVPMTLSPLSMAGWVPLATAASSDAVVTFKVDGVTIGTITFLAGVEEAVVAFTSTFIPADTDFEIVAPSPQDATLADFTITLAFSS